MRCCRWLHRSHLGCAGALRCRSVMHPPPPSGLARIVAGGDGAWSASSSGGVPSEDSDPGSDASSGSPTKAGSAAEAAGVAWAPAVPHTLQRYSRWAGGAQQALQLRVPATLQPDRVAHLLRRERWAPAGEAAAKPPGGGWAGSVALREAAEIEFLATLPLEVTHKVLCPSCCRQCSFSAAPAAAALRPSCCRPRPLVRRACLQPLLLWPADGSAAHKQRPCRHRTADHPLAPPAWPDCLPQDAAALLGVGANRLYERARWADCWPAHCLLFLFLSTMRKLPASRNARGSC